ncbi:hypothetical protein HPP92_013142 [Vanilla planifolia]|uniref:Uncharacterized protein n=1 Tax=Vanilla planifolia TaxID=51239 RepID=A0A835QV27_VANPL|nr:hypothetical protein HPP92_013142 [Vanilla planifolia]
MGVFIRRLLNVMIKGCYKLKSCQGGKAEAEAEAVSIVSYDKDLALNFMLDRGDINRSFESIIDLKGYQGLHSEHVMKDLS